MKKGKLISLVVTAFLFFSFSNCYEQNDPVSTNERRVIDTALLAIDSFARVKKINYATDNELFDIFYEDTFLGPRLDSLNMINIDFTQTVEKEFEEFNKEKKDVLIIYMPIKILQLQLTLPA